MDFFSALGGLSTVDVVVLMISLLVAFGFEFVNGFHDTANAVATGLAVAFSIVHLLPVDLLVNLGLPSGILMVLSLLISAIVWNFGTWYLGLPASARI